MTTNAYALRETAEHYEICMAHGPRIVRLPKSCAHVVTQVVLPWENFRRQDQENAAAGRLTHRADDYLSGVAAGCIYMSFLCELPPIAPDAPLSVVSPDDTQEDSR